MNETPVSQAAAPAKKATPAFLAVCALVLVFAAGLRIKEALDLRNPVLAEATLRGRSFTVEVADSSAKRELGLGKRDSLPAGQGMYFPFDAAGRWTFWMKDMRFPIDIIWIRDGKVVDIVRSAPVPKSIPLETFSPIEPADAVLELNAGAAAEIGLEAGDEIAIKTL